MVLPRLLFSTTCIALALLGCALAPFPAIAEDDLLPIVTMTPAERMQFLRTRARATPQYLARYASTAAVAATNGLDYAAVLAVVRSEAEFDVALRRAVLGTTVTSIYAGYGISSEASAAVEAECGVLEDRSLTQGSSLSSALTRPLKKRKRGLTKYDSR